MKHFVFLFTSFYCELQTTPRRWLHPEASAACPGTRALQSATAPGSTRSATWQILGYILLDRGRLWALPWVHHIINERVHWERWLQLEWKDAVQSTSAPAASHADGSELLAAAPHSPCKQSSSPCGSTQGDFREAARWAMPVHQIPSWRPCNSWEFLVDTSFAMQLCNLLHCCGLFFSYGLRTWHGQKCIAACPCPRSPPWWSNKSWRYMWKQHQASKALLLS